MKPDIIQCAREALAELEPGPWVIDADDGQPIEHQHYEYDSSDEWYDVDGPNGGWKAHCEDLTTAEFIVAARTLMPDLVAEVKRLRAQVKDQNAALITAWQAGYSEAKVQR